MTRHLTPLTTLAVQRNVKQFRRFVTIAATVNNPFRAHDYRRAADRYAEALYRSARYAWRMALLDEKG